METHIKSNKKYIDSLIDLIKRLRNYFNIDYFNIVYLNIDYFNIVYLNIDYFDIDYFNIVYFNRYRYMYINNVLQDHVYSAFSLTILEASQY